LGFRVLGLRVKRYTVGWVHENSILHRKAVIALLHKYPSMVTMCLTFVAFALQTVLFVVLV
jgi:hypothetical protein